MALWDTAENRIRTYGINMIDVSHTRFRAPNSECFQEHWHENMEIISVKEGDAVFSVAEKKFHVKANDIVIIGPRELHGGVAGDNGISYSYVMFDVRNFYNRTQASSIFIESIYNNKTKFERITNDADIASALESIYRLDGESDGIGAVESLSQIYHLIFLLYERCQMKNADSSIYEQRLQGAVSYVDSHFTEKLLLSEISQKFGYSKSHFCRKFRASTGFTFSTYIRMLRLEYAKKLLRETELDMASISALCGFPDNRNFSSNFRRAYDISPSKFRAHHTK